MTIIAENATVKAVTLIHQSEERSAYPGLDRIAHLLAGGLAQLMDECGTPGAMGRWCATSFGSFDDWLSQLPQRMVSIRFRMAPLKGSVLLNLPLDLIVALVDHQYGGDGNFRTEKHALTTAEKQYFQRLAQRIGMRLNQAWKDAVAVEPSVTNLETTGAPPTLVPGSHKVVVQTISMQVDARRSYDFVLITPMAVVRAVPQLAEPLGLEEAPPLDPVWQAAFTNSVMDVRLPIRTIFARPELPLAQLLALKPGDIIPVCLPDRLPVTIAGRHFANGSIGEANGRAAIRIEHIERGSNNHE